MSQESLPFNPYRPPDEILAEPVGRGRPGLLTTVCVLAMILGGLGLLTGLAGMAGILGGKQLQQAFQPQKQPGMSDEMFEIQRQMQDEMYAVADQFFVVNALLLVVHLGVAVSLIAGGILALGMKPAGRTILVYVCIAALFFEAGRTVVNTMVQVKNLVIMETYMQKMFSLGPQRNDPQATQVMKTAMKVGAIIGFVFAGAMVLIKVVYYGGSLYYLTRPKIMRLYAAGLPGNSYAPLLP